MRVMGIDPGLTRCGIGVVQGAPNSLRLVAVGVIRTPADQDVEQRLLTLHEEMGAAFSRYQPDAIAVERVFARANIRSIMGTAQSSAIPLLSAALQGIPVSTYTPSEMKAAVTGNGRANKSQVTSMVTRILGLDAPPRPADAADGLALAITHHWRGRAQERLLSAQRSQLGLNR